MTIGELKAKLEAFDNDLPVFINADGVLSERIIVEETNAHKHSPEGSWFEDFFAESAPDEGETRLRVVLFS